MAASRPMARTPEPLWAASHSERVKGITLIKLFVSYQSLLFGVHIYNMINQLCMHLLVMLCVHNGTVQFTVSVQFIRPVNDQH